MGLLNVDVVGLQMLAAHCQSWAAEISGPSAPESTGMSCQATSTAVSAVHADVAAAAQVMAAHLQSIATYLTAASDKYIADDNTSAAYLRNQIAEV
jgi:Excreted virulence factor EspC, type VII ESX diderm